jgi:hypothetical protein
MPEKKKLVYKALKKSSSSNPAMWQYVLEFTLKFGSNPKDDGL